MKEFYVDGSVVRVIMEDGKKYAIATKWVETSMKNLETDMEDVVLMWLEDNDKLVNEELEELDKQAKGQVKVNVESKPKKKTPKERVAKPQPEKEYIIGVIAEFLEDITDISNLKIENKAKLITFSYKNEDYKLDLVQKRKKKEEK